MREIKGDPEKFLKYNDLFDLYRPLLTKKQIVIIEKYFIYDLSESEIAEDLDITRNAVHDALDNITKKLDKFESELHLYVKYKKLNELIHASNLDDGLKKEILEILYYGI